MSLMNRNIPDNVVVRSSIVMDETVSHSGDASPWNFLVEAPNILGNPFGGFPNDFQASDSCPFCLFIIDEVRKRELT